MHALMMLSNAELQRHFRAIAVSEHEVQIVQIEIEETNDEK